MTKSEERLIKAFAAMLVSHGTGEPPEDPGAGSVGEMFSDRYSREQLIRAAYAALRVKKKPRERV